MLKVTIPGVESFDEVTRTFSESEPVTIHLEHSLLSLAAWESKWEISFLATEDKTQEHIADYVRTMILDEEYPDDVVFRLSEEQFQQIFDYIGAKRTATTVSELPNRGQRREIVTAEVIYSWMVTLRMGKEYETWHLSQLITLIKVLSAKNAPPNKNQTSQAALMARNRELNRKRRAEMESPG